MKTDKQLQTDVMAELSWDPSVNAAHIGVEVEQGVVTLSGHVENLTEKWSAERVVKRVSGVRAVAFDLDVKLPETDKRNDTDIAVAAINILEYASSIPKGAIQVTAEDGVLTLRGDVAWDYQRQTAESLLEGLNGVRNVINLVSVKPNVSLSAVRSEIESALKRRAYLDAQEIQVTVEGDVITLSGKVHSWTEKNLAINSAWGTPGVRSVVDKLSFV
ncbi:OsmY domain-containing protein [Limnohabitans sp. T6-5]|uniref:BON domain-containing protein n=1 Tax=Limnohabitans sp. T6-5 TaxID=1100724 RepID=UPI000D3B4963|nr:BON domain-containing protein [Limnohabitans sp. T6-5]PUE06934.1 OsmY domain-containing protein [Limnohabitans sp. T6-5]